VCHDQGLGLHVTVTLRALPPWLPRLAQGHRQNSTGAARAQSGERLLQMRRAIKLDRQRVHLLFVDAKDNFWSDNSCFDRSADQQKQPRFEEISFTNASPKVVAQT